MPDTFELLKFDRFTLDQRRRELRVDGTLVPVEGKKFDLLAFLVAHRDESVSRDEILAHVWGGRAVSEGAVTVQLHALRKALASAGCEGAMILTLPNQRYRFVGEMAREAPAPHEPDAPAPDLVLPDPAPPQPAPPDIAPPDIAVPDPPDLLQSPDPPPEIPITQPASSSHPKSRRPWWLAAAAAAAIILAAGAAMLLRGTTPAQRFSIVVLPFRNLSDDRSQDYMADAITDDLTADLAHIPGSTVIARESASAAATRTPQQIGHTLHVRYIVRGSLVPEGPSLHLTALLEDTETGTQLWTDRFDQIRNNLSATREDIVHRIASALHVQLDQLESTRSLHDRPNNPDALDLFFRARASLDAATTREELSAAQALLEKAVAGEPDFVDAKAELAWLLLRKSTTMDDPDEDRDYARAKELVSQALTLSPQNVMALSARAKIHQTDGHCDEAKADAAEAVRIDSSSLQPRTVLARCAQLELNFDEAASQYETMLKLNPSGVDNGTRYLALGYIRVVQGQFPEAIELLDRAVAENHGDPDPYAGMDGLEQAKLMLFAAYDLSGKTAEAASAYKAYAQIWPGRTVWRVSSYFPKAWLGLAGMKRIQEALRHAGMPAFADEYAPGLPDATPCGPGDFAPTPRSIPGSATVLDTEAVMRWKADSPPPVIIDVGRGFAVMEGAVWRDPAIDDETADAFALHAASAGPAATRRHVIIMGDGPTGCSSFNAARTLAAAGASVVGWYRGGEESWFHSGRGKSEDRRLY